MSQTPALLPHEDGRLFLSDGGIETVLIFNEGIDLPYFAAFDLLKNETGRDTLRDYFRRYAAIARDNATGFIFESPTWRASTDWGEKLGYSPSRLFEANTQAIELMKGVRDEIESASTPTLMSGCIGPRGDGYDAGAVMTPADAQAYHALQVGAFKSAGTDLVTAITMTNSNEAIGIARAAQAAGLPSVIAFTVETDGRLPTGETLRSAIESVDAATGNAPAYYMVNCAHPTHFEDVLADEAWARRLGGIRANASRKSHAELDNSEELDAGDPTELGALYADIRGRLPRINVLGGCCGTDHRHIEQIIAACKPGVLR